MREEKNRGTQTRRLRDERTDRMGETGKGAVHLANTFTPCTTCLGTLWGQDSKGPICRELPVLRVRQTPINKQTNIIPDREKCC